MSLDYIPIVKQLGMHHSVHFKRLCAKHCKHESITGEDDVKVAAKKYLCLIADPRFDNLELRELLPYIAELNDETREPYGYGWTSEDGLYISQNMHNPVWDWHNDPKVVAFKAIK